MFRLSHTPSVSLSRFFSLSRSLPLSHTFNLYLFDFLFVKDICSHNFFLILNLYRTPNSVKCVVYCVRYLSLIFGLFNCCLLNLFLFSLTPILSPSLNSPVPVLERWIHRSFGEGRRKWERGREKERGRKKPYQTYVSVFVVFSSSSLSLFPSFCIDSLQNVSETLS